MRSLIGAFYTDHKSQVSTKTLAGHPTYEISDQQEQLRTLRCSK